MRSDNLQPVEVVRGGNPIVLGLPHTGTHLPEDVASALTPRGAELADTDWHVHTLYDGLLDGVTTVRATFSRYVIDANRAPSDDSLYPGQNTTGLVPLTDFDGANLWEQAPEKADIAERLQHYHAPYHEALRAELARVKALHGIAILYDCHSIRSRIPFLFDGVLPDFNIGTNLEQTCAPEVQTIVEDICSKAHGYSSVTNGRFKGGWTTREYGQPEHGVHAIQMELAQSTYLQDECEPWAYSKVKAVKLRKHLAEILTGLTAWATQKPKA